LAFAASPPDVVEKLQDMPGQALGFRLSGKLTRDEYFQILDPVREKLFERGVKVSFLIDTAPDFHGLDLGAVVGGRDGCRLGRARTPGARVGESLDRRGVRHPLRAGCPHRSEVSARRPA
jgi:hypothetical protein